MTARAAGDAVLSDAALGCFTGNTVGDTGTPVGQNRARALGLIELVRAMIPQHPSAAEATIASGSLNTDQRETYWSQDKPHSRWVSCSPNSSGIRWLLTLEISSSLAASALSSAFLVPGKVA